jgi:hypothetical protein
MAPIEAWTSTKSFRPRDDDDRHRGGGDGQNGLADFRGEKRSNDTHASTTIKSPQSNGISEVLVHILKRDYLQVSPLPNARHALALLTIWIDDYNENHIYSRLKMRPPREFRVVQFATPEGGR